MDSFDEGSDGTKVPAFPGACGGRILLEAKEMTTDIHTGHPALIRLPRRLTLTRRVVGGFYLSMGGVHLGIVAANPLFYAPFAQSAHFEFVRSGWSQIFMAHPAIWGLALAAGETTIGLFLLTGGKWARFGWGAVIAFHLALMLFGWGIWMWSVPALAFLIPAARSDRFHGLAPATGGVPTPTRSG